MSSWSLCTKEKWQPGGQINMWGDMPPRGEGGVGGGRHTEGRFSRQVKQEVNQWLRYGPAFCVIQIKVQSPRWTHQESTFSILKGKFHLSLLASLTLDVPEKRRGFPQARYRHRFINHGLNKHYCCFAHVVEVPDMSENQTLSGLGSEHHPDSFADLAAFTVHDTRRQVHYSRVNPKQTYSALIFIASNRSKGC